jgi:hypothetical protein
VRPRRTTRPRPSPAAAERAALSDSAIDRLYGLDPVIEPGAADTELGGFVLVECPYCGESYGTPLDFTSGSFTYIEDCQVCCQPIELAVEVDDAGALASVAARRLD